MPATLQTPSKIHGVSPKFYRPAPIPETEKPKFAKPDVPTEELVAYINNIVRTDFRNVLPDGDNPPIWDLPVIGIASAHDPLFRRLQAPEAVGPMHRLPEDWLPGVESVISVFLPFSDPIWKSYKPDSRYSSREFGSGRWNGAKFLNVIRRALIRFADEHGGIGLAPNIDPRYGVEGPRPFWSERHVAFAAGVGTFGLHQNLITAKGSYGRICSAVTTLKLDPTPRDYTDVYGHCLYVSHGTCGTCIDRCPTKAITVDGKVLGLCGKNGNGEHWKAWGYWACGHCQTFTPCSRGIPQPDEVV